MTELKEYTSLQTKKTSGTLLSPKQYRSAVMDLEKFVSSLPDTKFGDDVAPLEHTFVDGAYIRKITMPAGQLVISKIHKVTHPYFVMSGEVDVLTENGMQRIKAPYHGITKAGTKRVLLTHTETVWITVHVTNETDLDKIEKEIIAESYKELEKEDLCLGQSQEQPLLQ